jgi:hypothetical protein
MIMNYEKIHDSLIQRAKIRNWTRKSAPCYVEKHHIVPKSLGGTNTEENLVFLTAKEHYLVHLLMTKFYTGDAHSKMLHAFIRLCEGNDPMKRVVSPIMYERRKNEVRPFLKTFLGRTHTPEIRERIAASKRGKPRSAECIAKIKATKKMNRENLSPEEWVVRFPKKDLYGDKNPMYGKKHSEETKKKMRKAKPRKKMHQLSPELYFDFKDIKLD